MRLIVALMAMLFASGVAAADGRREYVFHFTDFAYQ